MAALVWQGCHTLLICAHPCNLWENILRHKLLWVLWVLWGDSLVAAWVWQGCHTLLICAHPCNLWENILCQKLLWALWVLWEDSLVFAWGSPTEFTEFTEASGVEEPPTDAHRCSQMLGCVGFSHGIHGTHRNFWQRRASHRCSQMLGCVGFSHGIHGIHRWLGCVVLSHEFHRYSQMFSQWVQQSLLHPPSRDVLPIEHT